MSEQSRGERGTQDTSGLNQTHADWTPDWIPMNFLFPVAWRLFSELLISLRDAPPNRAFELNLIEAPRPQQRDSLAMIRTSIIALAAAPAAGFYCTPCSTGLRCPMPVARERSFDPEFAKREAEAKAARAGGYVVPTVPPAGVYGSTRDGAPSVLEAQAVREAMYAKILSAESAADAKATDSKDGVSRRDLLPLALGGGLIGAAAVSSTVAALYSATGGSLTSAPPAAPVVKAVEKAVTDIRAGTAEAEAARAKVVSELAEAATERYFPGAMSGGAVDVAVATALSKRGYTPQNTLFASSVGDRLNRTVARVTRALCLRPNARRCLTQCKRRVAGLPRRGQPRCG